MSCTCSRVLGTRVFLEHPRKTRVGCADKSCASNFLSWTAGPVGRGQISQETEGLFPSWNPVCPAVQVAVVPLLGHDPAEVPVPVHTGRCSRGAQAVLECDFTTCAQHVAQCCSPSCHAALQDANGPSEWQMGCAGAESSHSLSHRQLLLWGLEKEQEKLFPLELFSSSLSYFSTCDSQAVRSSLPVLPAPWM